MKDKLDSITSFEIVAELYRQRFGCLAPGKDEASATYRNSCSDENREQYIEWLATQAWKDALIQIDALQVKLNRLEEEIEDAT